MRTLHCEGRASGCQHRLLGLAQARSSSTGTTVTNAMSLCSQGHSPAQYRHTTGTVSQSVVVFYANAEEESTTRQLLKKTTKLRQTRVSPISAYE
jgi:hypothetical protein